MSFYMVKHPLRVLGMTKH
uniref:Uncharacterized protein n=1 Tax=Rhizophora mucronata TaxID=61149 RepID=A0A2P2J0H7_RHIMU